MGQLTVDRATIEQALEALEDVDGPITALLGNLLGSPDTDAPGAKVRAAVNALRAALAQEMANGSWHDGVLEGHLRERERWLAQEQAKPVQEPAANRGSAKAVQIAIALEEGNFLLSRDRNATAAELRRLAAENESLKAERDEDRRRDYGYSQQVVDALTKERNVLRAQRDALLGALRPFAETDLTNPTVRDTFGFNVLFARAAIAKAEGKT